MKRWYPALILLCLLLAGCSGKGEETTFPTQTEAVPVEAAPPAGLHDPYDPVEVRYGDALRAYPLSAANVAGMKAMGSDLLVFSDTEVSTRITRLSGEELYIAATARLDFGLTPDNPSLQVTESGLSYFDPVNRQGSRVRPTERDGAAPERHRPAMPRGGQRGQCQHAAAFHGKRADII